jgi:hypothetical protein
MTVGPLNHGVVWVSSRGWRPEFDEGRNPRIAANDVPNPEGVTVSADAPPARVIAVVAFAFPPPLL